MSDPRTDEFIDVFRQLEAALREQTIPGGSSRDFAGMLHDLARKDPFVRNRWSELDLCRQIRNLLSHFPMMEGRRPLVPDGALITVMQQTLEHILYPVTARSAAVPRSRLFTVERDSSVKSTVQIMRERGFSHIPVMEGERVIAVFSAGCVFTAACEGTVAAGSGDRIGDWLPRIGLSDHENESYAFVAAEERLTEVKELFQRPASSRKKVAAAFVTAGGSPGEPLLGMLTPWDVLRALEE